MSYVSPDYPNKKALKDALTAGKSVESILECLLEDALTAGKSVEVYQPGLGTVPVDGTIALEGPHYPKPHTWYATGTMRGGVSAKVK